ncbi:MAG: lipopolysaccharide heptosyltransferase II [Planctomycetes bacterium]|nr:lipopolysaccharide heptosyltransferase II [Planctomycetota bacterium]
MNVLVVCPNWVGDAVMATPALRALRRGFSGARIVGLMRPVIADVLDGLGCFDVSLVWKPRSKQRSERTWSVIKALRRERIDLAVLLPNSFHSAAVAWLAGARRRVGYRRDGRGWLLTDAIEPLKAGRRFVPTPVIDYYLELAYYLGCPRESYRLSLATTPADEQAADRVWTACRLGTAERVVVLNPGAAYGLAKCWPTEHFADLARNLARMHGTQVLVLCGPTERTMAQTIVQEADYPSVHSLADFPVSIGLSKACVRRCDLMIATDSGPRHLAAAFDVPVITLFGPTHIEWSETYFDKALHLQKKVPCGPCQLRECPLDHRCMRELEPEQVLRSALDMLDRFPREARPLRRPA